MTFVMLDYHGHTYELTDAAAAGSEFDEQAAGITSTGKSGQVILFQPASGPPHLRVDIDIDAGRAAVRWLPDDSYAVELPRAAPLSVLASADGGIVEVPAELARVSAATARRLVTEYVSSGRRPASVSWTQP